MSEAALLLLVTSILLMNRGVTELALSRAMKPRPQKDHYCTATPSITNATGITHKPHEHPHPNIHNSQHVNTTKGVR